MERRSAASEVATRVRDARAGGWDARADEAELVRLLRPLIRREAGSVPCPGSAQLADLEQEGALAVLRACGSYRGAELDFLAYVRPLMRRAVRDFAALHGQDVRPSQHAQRGSTRWRPGACVVGSLSPSNPQAAAWLSDVEDSAPVPSADSTVSAREDREELLAAVQMLEPEHRYIVERHFGLGTFEATSSRELARILGVSRTSTDGILGRALERLRELLSDADSAS